MGGWTTRYTHSSWRKTSRNQQLAALWRSDADRRGAAEWLSTYPDGNIGLPLGPCSGLIAVDIDTDDPEIIGAIEGVLPQTPWRRVGKKGAVLIFRWRDHKTTRIRDENEKTVCEILSRGTQIVIPPSIHPDTGKPYWANCNLVDILPMVPVAPQDIAIIIRGVLADLGIKVSRTVKTGVTQFVPAGSRDNALVSTAGLFAMAVSRGERTLRSALDQIAVWVETFTQKVVGDEMSIEKAQQKLVQFLISDVMGEKKKTLPTGWDEGMTPEELKALGLTPTEENLAWSYEKATEFLHKVISETMDMESIGFRNNIEFLLGRMAASNEISTMQVDSLLKTIHDLSAKRITMLALRKRLKELQGGKIEGNDHTEIAEAMLKDLGKYDREVRGEGGKLWRWDGACWAELEEDEINQLLYREYSKLPAAKKAGDHVGIIKVLHKLAYKPLAEVNVPGLNFANGYLTADLDSGRIDKIYGATYTLPYRYLPERWDRASLWTEFLYDIWGEDKDYVEKVQCLQEAIAATMFGIAPQHQRVSALGGKCHRQVDGQECRRGPAARRDEVSGQPDGLVEPVPSRPDVRQVAQQCRRAQREEEDPGCQVQGDRDRRHDHGPAQDGQPFEFRPKAAHWFSSNHPPDSDESDDGFSRRWIFFFFENKIPSGKRITNYADILLEAEREEIAGVGRSRTASVAGARLHHSSVVDATGEPAQ